MYCVDTNIAIDIFRGDEELRFKIAKLINDGKQIFVSSVSLCELFKGAYIIQSEKKRDKELMIIKQFKDNLGILDLDENSSEEFGRLYVHLNRKGKMIPEPDIMIMAISKTNQMVLVTRDKKHFDNSLVKTEIW